MGYLESFWNYLIVSAPYLLVGLFLAGLINEFIPMEKVKKWLGGKSFGSVLRAALVGIPLPLCSCSVIPSAVTLKKSGANNAATSSFLIATPESGIDSIALTYALMGGPLAIIRPIAAFVSAIFAGVLQLIFNNKNNQINDTEKNESSCCASKKETTIKKSSLEKVKSGFSYGFGKLVDDIALWLFIGILAGSLIDFLVPEGFFLNLDPAYGRYVILLIGIPLYICATASTPIAVSLILKGLSPGAALVLLLVGPATNISNIAVLQKYIGNKGILINIFSISLVAILFSYITDFLFQSSFSLNISQALAHDHDEHTLIAHLSALILLGLILKGVWKEEIAPRLTKKESTCSH